MDKRKKTNALAVRFVFIFLELLALAVFQNILVLSFVLILEIVGRELFAISTHLALSANSRKIDDQTRELETLHRQVNNQAKLINQLIYHANNIVKVEGSALVIPAGKTIN